jgi:hypothetical protein
MLPEYVYWAAAGVVVIGIGIFIYALLNPEVEPDLSAYQRKPFLFDSKAEFDLFKILFELYAERFHIFPQVHYIHLIEPRRGLPRNEWFGLRSRIDKKSADFVLCDKERVVPQLIIELDGPTHDWPDRQKRDAFINEITKISDLKILHIKTGNLSRDFIRSEVEQALNPVKTA